MRKSAGFHYRLRSLSNKRKTAPLLLHCALGPTHTNYCDPLPKQAAKISDCMYVVWGTKRDQHASSMTLKKPFRYSLCRFGHNRRYDVRGPKNRHSSLSPFRLVVFQLYAIKAILWVASEQALRFTSAMRKTWGGILSELAVLNRLRPNHTCQETVSGAHELWKRKTNFHHFHKRHFTLSYPDE